MAAATAWVPRTACGSGLPAVPRRVCRGSRPVPPAASADRLGSGRLPVAPQLPAAPGLPAAPRLLAASGVVAGSGDGDGAGTSEPGLPEPGLAGAQAARGAGMPGPARPRPAGPASAAGAWPSAAWSATGSVRADAASSAPVRGRAGGRLGHGGAYPRWRCGVGRARPGRGPGQFGVAAAAGWPGGKAVGHPGAQHRAAGLRRRRRGWLRPGSPVAAWAGGHGGGRGRAGAGAGSRAAGPKVIAGGDGAGAAAEAAGAGGSQGSVLGPEHARQRPEPGQPRRAHRPGWPGRHQPAGSDGRAAGGRLRRLPLRRTAAAAGSGRTGRVAAGGSP